MNFPEMAIFAFNANVDYLKFVTDADLEKIDSFSPRLASKISECFTWGVQKEVSISARECDFFLSEIKYEKKLVGGQAGNAVEQASALGVYCFLHSNFMSRELVTLFSHPGNILVSKENVFVSADSFSSEMKSSHHFALENRENRTRFIASFDPFPMHIEDNFSRNITNELPLIGKAFIGGLHLLPTPERLHKFTEEITRWKETNPSMKIFLELGEFQNEKVKELVMHEIFPLVDFIGLNDVELSSLGCEPDELAQQATVLLHTPESHSVFPEEKTDAAALEFAKRCASFKAKNGRCASGGEIIGYEAEFVGSPAHTVGLGDAFSCAYFMAV